jgi:hypothetical protein
LKTAHSEFKLSVGASSKHHTTDAIEEAAETALQHCEEPQFGIVFATDDYDPEELALTLTKRMHGIPWAGCTSAGVFAQNRFMRHGVVIALLSSSEVHVGVGTHKLNETNSREAGAQSVSAALSQLKMDPNTSNDCLSLIVLADAKLGNVAEVIRGGVEEAGLTHTWAGGGVGNVFSSAKSTEFAHGRAYNEHVVVIAIKSPSPVITGMGHGWRPYGIPTMVTRAHGSTVEELEYEHAFETYRATAANKGEGVSRAEFVRFAMTHPLGIPQADGNYVIRDPVGVQEDGSLNFIAEVPDGCMVRMMEGNRDELLRAARRAAECAKQPNGAPPRGALIFDCISRFMLLENDYSIELDTFLRGLGEQTPFVGCLTLGEVGAFGKGIPQFHNKTAVVMSFYG